MPISRRQLTHRLAGMALALSPGAIALPHAATARERPVVIVRTREGIRRVDPRTGEIDAWDGPLPATPAPLKATPPGPVPGAIATPVTEGAVDYWMAAPGGDAFVFRVDTGAAAAWWWRRGGGRPTSLGLPGDLEPAFPSGTVARWFHGATVDAAHLGSGSLRLLAVDIAAGEFVLDHALDRRLELAATAVSDDGAIVAHVQAANTGVAFWAADLRGGTRVFAAGVGEEPGLAAASAIDLDVAADREAILVAAGLAGDWPGAPGATVHILRAESPGAVFTVSLQGELIGILPAG